MRIRSTLTRNRQIAQRVEEARERHIQRCMTMRRGL